MSKLESRRSTFLSPTAGHRRGGDRGRHGDAPKLADERPARTWLEQRFAEVTGAEHAVALASGTAAMHRARRPRRRPRRRGDHEPDHVARDGERRRARRRHAGLRRRTIPTSTSTPSRFKAVTPRTKAILPVDLAGQPADLGRCSSSVSRDRGRRARGRCRACGGRSARSRRDVLLPLRDEERHLGEGGVVTTNDEALADELRELRFMRRGTACSTTSASRASRRTCPMFSPRSPLPARQARTHADIRRRHVQAYDAVVEARGRDAARARPRDQHAMHLYVVRIDAEKAGADRDAYQRAPRRRTSARASTSCRCTRSATTARTIRTSRGCRSPSAQAARCLAAALAGALGRRHRGCDRGAAPRARLVHRLSRRVRILIQVLVSGAILAYLIWRVDLGETIDILADSNLAYVAGAVALFVATTWAMAWRWQALLASKGLHEADRLADEALLRQLCGRPGPAHRGRRGRGAHRRARPQAAGRQGGSRGRRPHGASDRIGRDARRGRARPCDRGGPLRGRPLRRVDRGGGRPRDDPLPRPHLLAAHGPPPRRARVPARPRGFASSARSRASTRPCTSTAGGPRAPLRARPDDRLAARARRRHLVLRRGRRHRRLAARLLRARPPSLLRADGPFTLNGLGVREAFFVGFLSRFDVPADQAFAGRCPLLRRAAPHLAAGCAHPPVAERTARRVQQEA